MNVTQFPENETSLFNSSKTILVLKSKAKSKIAKYFFLSRETSQLINKEN